MGYAGVVLAGGAGGRMGGVLKPLLPVGGQTMLSRVVGALDGADPVVVVGPPELAAHLPAGVRVTREEPPGSGPVAATAAGVALTGDAEWVAVVGGDLPFLAPGALAALRHNARDGAVYVDDDGRRQPMVTVWRAHALRLALSGAPASMRELLRAADVTEVGWRGGEPPPWFDCDTPEELRRAEGWL